jgi:hypothetical protein
MFSSQGGDAGAGRHPDVFGRVCEISLHLPAQCRVGVEKPPDHVVDRHDTSLEPRPASGDPGFRVRRDVSANGPQADSFLVVTDPSGRA